MKLLLATRFYPAVGGLETVMEALANEWTAAGHEVRIATDVSPPPPSGRRFPFTVQYQPKNEQLLALVKWCDVYVQGCIGLKTLWPLARHRRTYVATHQTWYRREDGRIGWQNRLKRWVSRYAINIAPSNAVAADLPAPCSVIPNPYHNDVFKVLPGHVRSRDLVFVGRLVPDKGADLLLQAVAILRGEGMRLSATIIGDGPETPLLRQRVTDLGLADQVIFSGSRSAAEVAVMLNQHRILVVPSLWNEPFGVVALEGIACGCLVVGSEGGGLKDAIGPCGLTFPNRDVSALVERIKILAHSRVKIEQAIVDQHLAGHSPSSIAKRYIDVMLAASNR